MTRATGLDWESAVETHTGRVRRANEDSVLSRNDIGLWAVADGMGGHSAGADASRLVVEGLAALRRPATLADFAGAVEESLKRANAQLIQGANGDISGSTVAVLLNVGDRGAAIWVGDSRIYRCRSGRLEQLSRDHSQVEEWIAKGLLDREDVDSHPPSNIITRAIGAETSLEPESSLFEISPGDSYLICSDGLYNEVSDREIERAMASQYCAVATRGLLDLALERGARDNVSLIITHARSEDEGQTKTLINPLLSTG